MSRLLVLILALMPLAAFGGEVQKERFGGGADSAPEAWAAVGGGRMGLLLVPTERSPDPGLRYGAWNLLTESRQLEGDPHRMPEPYELRLYEALRGAFTRQGYEVSCLNRGDWQDRELKELFPPGADAVCAAHYSIRRTRRILSAQGHDWWSPFAGMALSVKLTVFDARTEDVIHELELRSLGTERLYEALTDTIAEEPLYPSGYDVHGSPNAYRIAVYNTELKDLRKNADRIPVIRTAKGSLDIAVTLGRWVSEKRLDEQEMRRLNIPIPDDVAEQNSVLSRMLQYVAYRPQPDDITLYDLLSIRDCGQTVAERIPPHPGS